MSGERMDAEQNVDMAFRLLDQSDQYGAADFRSQTGEDQSVLVLQAQVHATLALVEQQRIANLMQYLVLLDEGRSQSDEQQIRTALGLEA